MGRSPVMESGRRSLVKPTEPDPTLQATRYDKSCVPEKCRALTSGGRCASPTESHYSHAREAPGAACFGVKHAGFALRRGELGTPYPSLIPSRRAGGERLRRPRYPPELTQPLRTGLTYGAPTALPRLSARESPIRMRRSQRWDDTCSPRADPIRGGESFHDAVLQNLAEHGARGRARIAVGLRQIRSGAGRQISGGNAANRNPQRGRVPPGNHRYRPAGLRRKTVR